MKLALALSFILTALYSDSRSIYSVGDTLSIQDQNLEFNVCHTNESYSLNEIFKLSDYNGSLNGGDYKVFLISMNATW